MNSFNLEGFTPAEEAMIYASITALQAAGYDTSGIKVLIAPIYQPAIVACRCRTEPH
jgi:hypothetical protein